MDRIPELWIALLGALFLLAGCAQLPELSPMPHRRIEVGWGPEDMVPDTTGGAVRLIISCDERRGDVPHWSGIVAYDLQSGRADTLDRVGEPAGLDFRPHGIHLQTVDGERRLYVINHREKQDKLRDEEHSVLVYRLDERGLVWLRTLNSGHFRSPNALLAMPDGSFYLSNDSYKRGSLLEKALKLKRSRLVYCDAEGQCRVEETKVAYGNGLAFRDGYLYQAATRGNHVLRYRVGEHGSLSGKAVICKGLVGADNLRFYGNSILVACHPRPFAFLGHARNPEKHSPSEICIFDPGDYEAGGRPLQADVLFYDDGSRISGGSTALVHANKLYISQVFQPYLLELTFPGNAVKVYPDR